MAYSSYREEPATYFRFVVCERSRRRSPSGGCPGRNILAPQMAGDVAGVESARDTQRIVYITDICSDLSGDAH